MRKFVSLSIFLLVLLSCNIKEDYSKKIILLAHSTGTNLFNQGDIPGWFEEYNKSNGTNYDFELRTFPKSKFYGWSNYPFDYWNIWVRHNGYKFEPSLRKLTRSNDLIIWKHCYPGSAIQEDKNEVDVSDYVKTLGAYKLQYKALKEEMLKYPNTDFLVWTLAVKREEDLSQEEALRTKEFVDWVNNVWDESGDNIYIWDFYGYETTSKDGTEQSLYIRPEYDMGDSHPNEEFNVRVAPFLCEDIVSILNGNN